MRSRIKYALDTCVRSILNPTTTAAGTKSVVSGRNPIVRIVPATDADTLSRNRIRSYGSNSFINDYRYWLSGGKKNVWQSSSNQLPPCTINQKK